MRKCKNILLICMIFFLLATPVFAFLYEVKILTREEAKKLTNEQLIQVYTDAMIERKASEIFQGKAGFTPKEYQSFKDLLGLIVRLREEMNDRQIEPPPLDEWLR